MMVVDADMNKKIIKKISSITITFVLVILIFFVLFPPSTAVFLSPGTIPSQPTTIGTTIKFQNVNLTIRGEERIPISYLNFSIFNEANDACVGFIRFTVEGVELSDFPTGKLMVTNKTEIPDSWYDYGYGYGYDEQAGQPNFFDYGYGYGYNSYTDITILYDITYITSQVGSFYTKLSVNSTSVSNDHLYESNPSDTFQILSTQGDGGTSPPSGGGETSVNQLPIANITGPKTGYVNETIGFSGIQSIDPDGQITSYSWDLGDGSIKMGQDITHTYTSIGLYTITLTVYDDTDAEATSTISIYISNYETTNRKPVPDPYVPTKGITNTTLAFDSGGSYDSDGTIIYYLWDLGDGTIKESENISSLIHIYQEPGPYIVTLTVIDDGGESDSASKQIIIYDALSPLINSGYLIDTSNDGIPDMFYDSLTQKSSLIQELDDGRYLIDSDDDGAWDYIYTSATGEIKSYQKDDDPKTVPWVFLMIALGIVILVVIIIVLFKTGIIYIEKK